MNIKKPEGWQSVVPRLFTQDCKGLVEFLREVFDAEGEFHEQRPSELKIGDSKLMVSNAEVRGEYHSCFYVYLSNVEETFKRAIAKGAAVVEEPLITPYGDKRAVFIDTWGNMWQVAEFEPN